MAGMSEGKDDHQTTPFATGPAPGSSPEKPSRVEASPTVRQSIRFLEHTQDIVTITVGIILIVLAAVILVAALVDFVDNSHGKISSAAPGLIDQVLLVLILVEIVHTVVLSLRAHRLIAQPFIVVGLIAVIRRILFVLNPVSQYKASTSELALLIAMVAVFVAALIAVSIFERREQ
jgi:uncharacterized membrane protein (DUF373 family)